MEVVFGIYILGAIFAFFKVNMCQMPAPKYGKLVVVALSWIGFFQFQCL